MSHRIPLQDCLSDEHLAGIGLIVAEWAHVEQLLKMALCNLMDDSPAGSTRTRLFWVVTGMDVRATIGLIKTLTRIKISSEEQLTRLDKILDGIERLKQWRDIVAHATWHKGDRAGTTKPFGIKAMGKVKSLKGEVSARALRAMAYVIYRYGTHLVGFFQDHGLMKRNETERQSTGD